MGACGGKLSDEEKKALEANKEIEKELARMKKSMAKEVKLLLLGTGASGKSTVAKQMQIIYLKGFGAKEKEDYKRLIITNVVENMQALIKGAKKLNIPISTENSKIAEELVLWEPAEPDFIWTPDELGKVKRLWREEKGIQTTYSRRSEIQLNDSADQYVSQSFYNYRTNPAYKVSLRNSINMKTCLPTILMRRTSCGLGRKPRALLKSISPSASCTFGKIGVASLPLF